MLSLGRAIALQSVCVSDRSQFSTKVLRCDRDRGLINRSMQFSTSDRPFMNLPRERRSPHSKAERTLADQLNASFV